jgi:hypothetical protein
VKKCKMPEAAGSFIYAWLANPPAPGPSLEWLETGQDPVKDAVVQGMVLDPALPCKESFAKLEMEAIRYAIAHGIAGIADIVPKDGLRTSTARDDSGTVTAFTDKHVPLGFNVPQSLRKGSQLRVMSDMLVNDAHAFVLGMGDGKGDFRLLLFRKSDRTWRRVNSGGELYDSIRGFGRYLALVELRSKSAQNPRSAGMDAWKPGSNGLRPDLRSRIAENRDSFIYSGRLHLYDIETEKFYSISTNQGDSEVLLVESNVVYYRAAGQLFSAPITDRGIGRSQLLAEDDAILDAHWAFIKH